MNRITFALVIAMGLFFQKAIAQEYGYVVEIQVLNNDYKPIVDGKTTTNDAAFNQLLTTHNVQRYHQSHPNRKSELLRAMYEEVEN